MTDFKAKLFGHRALVSRLLEKTGSIVVPDNANVLHQIGRVVCVGNGQDPETVFMAKHGGAVMRVRSEPKPSLVNVGDIVYFQTNMIMAANNQYENGSESLLNLHQTDLIARLATPDVHYDNFTPLGKWVLVQPHQRTSDTLIVLPENLKTLAFIYWTLAKAGAGVDLPIEPGAEVMINTGRCNPIFIPTKADRADPKHAEYAYIDCDHVLGVVESSVAVA